MNRPSSHRAAPVLFSSALLLAWVSCTPLPPREVAPPAGPREQAPPPESARGLVRVALAESVSQAEVTVGTGEGRDGGTTTDRFRLSAGPGGELLLVRGAAGAGDKGQAQGEAAPPEAVPSPFQLTPVGEEGWVGYGGRRYRGALTVYGLAGGGLCVVNVVGVESYLRGVVPLEIGTRTPEVFEAVKAQTVAARTYALLSRGQYEGKPFDLYATVRDQVYEGIGAETEPADRAIRETAGEVLRHGGEFARTYYHSTCGGQTARIEEVWQKPPAPYLRGVPDFPPGSGEDESYCRPSPHFHWEERWTAAELATVLSRTLSDLTGRAITLAASDLEDVRVESRGQSGRVKWVAIRAGGETYRVFGDQVRWVFRPAGANGGGLRSARVEFQVKRRGGKFAQLTARGSGNGHGVGMCQFGAMGMSRAGKRYREILEHYYPGARVEVFR